MNVNDIVYLKSDNIKLMVTWITGVTNNKNIPIDVDKVNMNNPMFQHGDICIKYNKDHKATIPYKCLIEDLNNRTPATSQVLNVGNVVKHKLTDKEMVVLWIVGQKKESISPIDINKLFQKQGLNNGDIICGFFDKKEYKTEMIKKGEVIKIYE